MNILRLFARGHRREAELEEEINTHLRLAARDRIQRGEAPEEAARNAVREFGNVTLTKEVTRQMWGWTLFESLLADIRLGIRMLARTPGLFSVAALSIALGIGATVTIFSFTSALLFRPPGVGSQSELVELWSHDLRARSSLEAYVPLSYPDYVYFRDHNRALTGLAAFDGDPTPVTWNHNGVGETVFGTGVSGNFFSLLEVKPAIGRTLFPEDDCQQASPVVVLSSAFWTEHLGRDPAIIGKPLTLNGVSFTVAGVAPPEFTTLLAGIAPDFWVPLAATPRIKSDPGLLASAGSHWLIGIGRRRPGVTFDQADAEFRALSQRPSDRPDTRETLSASTFPAQIIPRPIRAYVAGFTGLLMVLVAVVLLIACANVATLMLARGEGRRREMAVRMALGARRMRVLRLALVETGLIALLGGFLGLFFAWWAKTALLGLKPASIPIRLQVPFDWRVLGFTVLMSLTAGLAFGIVPAMRNSRADASLALKAGRQTANPPRSLLARLLTVVQLSLSLLLLISAGLCVRSLVNARAIDPGFEPRHCAIATVDTATFGYPDNQGIRFDQQFLARVRSIPGVSSVSLASYLPLNATQRTVGIERSDSGSQHQSIVIQTICVGPDFFKTIGAPMAAGREFKPQDIPGAPGVAVINDALAHQWWPHTSPIGQHLTLLESDVKGQDLEIVGVAKTAKYRTLTEPPTPFLYLPFLQHYTARATIIARTAGDPGQLLESLRREAQNVDPRAALISPETMEQYLALPLFPVRTAAILFGVLGLIGLILAVSGLYALVTYNVSRRSSEIGIRMTLGARRLQVITMILKQSYGLVGAGATIGLGLALAAERALSSLLYGIGPADWLTYCGATVLLTLVTTLAALLPAGRATRLDPVVALRSE